MIEALTGLAVGAIGVVGVLVVALGRYLTTYLRVREAKLERMLARRGESTPPPIAAPAVRRRAKTRTLAERVFEPERSKRSTEPDPTPGPEPPSEN